MRSARGSASAASSLWLAITTIALLVLQAAAQTTDRFAILAPDSCETIKDKLVSTRELSLLAKAVEASGFDQALAGPGHTTLIAPTNTAFEKLAADSSGSDESYLDMDLYDLLSHHIIEGKADMSSIEGVLARIPTCNGEIIITDQIQPRSLQAGKSDTCETIKDKLMSTPELSLLAKAVEASGFDEALGGPGPMTLVAPTNKAFEKLAAESSGSDKNFLDMDLYDLLSHHIIDGKADTMDTSYIQGVISDRIPMCNGEIIMTDAVLIPSSLPSKKRKCAPGQCCDIPPDDVYTCQTQVEWGKCEEDWMYAGGFCRESCGHCSIGSMQNASVAHDRSTAFVHSGILYQQWRYLDGSDRISSLGRSRFMRSTPDYEKLIEGEDGSFEGPRTESGYPHTGARITGFFCAPMDGKYEFRLSSDDSSRLYILPSDLDIGDKDYSSYIHKQSSIVKVDGWKRRSQYEGPKKKMKMKRGKSYFFEVHHKNGGGSGHLKLGVVLPNGDWLPTIPATMFTKHCEDSRPEAAGAAYGR